MGRGRGVWVPAPLPQIRLQTNTAVCARCGKEYVFHFAPYRNGIAKIGQTPSPADIVNQDMLRFRDELDDLDMGELEHATRMFSLGVGVGAFVYLRRIFERLLERHHVAFVAANGPIEGYEDKMRWEERVLALSSVLPKGVIDNRKVYAILSVGIHELLEDECLLYYPVLRAAIVDILEQDIAAKQRAKSDAELRRAVDEIAGRVRPT